MVNGQCILDNKINSCFFLSLEKRYSGDVESGSGPRLSVSNPQSAMCELCNFGQVTSPFCAAAPPSMKGKGGDS